jgi:hypothetical protein
VGGLLSKEKDWLQNQRNHEASALEFPSCYIVPFVVRDPLRWEFKDPQSAHPAIQLPVTISNQHHQMNGIIQPYATELPQVQ